MKKLLSSFSNSAVATATILTLGTTPLCADSLWHDDSSRSMFSDKRAIAIGDIVTILVQENNLASRDNSTKTSKSTGIDASISSFLYPPTASAALTKKGKLPAVKMDSAQNFAGGGSISNSEKIAARIAVRVIDVLPNGNLILEGTRQTAFAGETQDVILRGTVRPTDIAANNTVFSYNVADATIKYVSKGTISNNQKKGWFTKIWDKVTPF